MKDTIIAMTMGVMIGFALSNFTRIYSDDQTRDDLIECQMDLGERDKTIKHKDILLRMDNDFIDWCLNQPDQKEKEQKFNGVKTHNSSGQATITYNFNACVDVAFALMECNTALELCAEALDQ